MRLDMISGRSNSLGSVNVYEYRYPAPPVPLLGVSRRTVLKEWGSLVSPDEVYCVKDLEEFVHTPAAHRRKAAHHNSVAKRKRIEEQDEKAQDGYASHGKIQTSASRTTEEHPAKRRKVCQGTIFDLIPPVRSAGDHLANDRPEVCSSHMSIQQFCTGRPEPSRAPFKSTDAPCPLSYRRIPVRYPHPRSMGEDLGLSRCEVKCHGLARRLVSCLRNKTALSHQRLEAWSQSFGRKQPSKVSGRSCWVCREAGG